MKNKLIAIAIIAAVMPGCSLFQKNGNNAVALKEAEKYPCKDCESEIARLKAEIDVLNTDLAYARKEMEEKEQDQEEVAVSQDESSGFFGRRLILHSISIAIGIALGYFALRCKKKV